MKYKVVLYSLTLNKSENNQKSGRQGVQLHYCTSVTGSQPPVTLVSPPTPYITKAFICFLYSTIYYAETNKPYFVYHYLLSGQS